MAGSEFGVGRRPAALVLEEPEARVSGYLSVKFLEFGCRAIWVGCVSGCKCGSPRARMWRIGVCQQKDILASLSPEVGVSRCLGALRLMGVQVQESVCVVSSCGLSRCLDVWAAGTKVSGCLRSGCLCVQQWATHALDYPVFVSLAMGCPVVGVSICRFRCVCLQERGVHVLGGKCPVPYVDKEPGPASDTPFPGSCLQTFLWTPRPGASGGSPVVTQLRAAYSNKTFLQ